MICLYELYEVKWTFLPIQNKYEMDTDTLRYQLNLKRFV